MDALSKMVNIQGLKMAKSIYIGNGSIDELGKQVKRLNGKKPLIITDTTLVKAGLLDEATTILKKDEFSPGIFPDVEFEPTSGVIERATAIIKAESYDIVIGIGGGSVLDASKIAAVLAKNCKGIREYIGKEQFENNGIPIILVPTTGGTGSEVSANAIFIDDNDGVKKLINDSKMYANVAIIDPNMTHSVPPKLTAYTGMDSFCHAMGAFITRNANPVTDALAIEAIRLVSRNLRIAVRNGSDPFARYNLSVAAAIGMIARINSGSGAVHGLSYPLTEKYHFPHGKAIALLLPHVMEFTVEAAVKKFLRVAEAMGENIEGKSDLEGAKRTVEAIKSLLKDTEIFEPLRNFGIKKDEFKEFAEFVYKFSLRHIEAHPLMLKKDDIVRIYQNAW